MNSVFCTLFDSNYIDKGLILYDSMVRSIKDFRLYVFAFDKKCYDILSNEKLDNMIVVSLDEFETPQLLNVKKERTKSEYCWTCSPWIIKYVLSHYNEKICTYVDADMMFFSSPECVFRDMFNNGKSVIIVPHRYKTKEIEEKETILRGRYCVEFNTFVNNADGLEALNWWADRCLEWCYYSLPGTSEWYADQKYLNVFPEKFKGTYICNHFGVGLAPWNTMLVTIDSIKDDVPYVKILESGNIYPVIIYHYENVAFITKHLLNASSRIHNEKLRQVIYEDYIKSIITKRKYIEYKYKYRLNRSRRVVTKNPFLKFYQRFISPFRRISNIRDLYWVKETDL